MQGGSKWEPIVELALVKGNYTHSNIHITAAEPAAGYVIFPINAHPM